MRSELIVDELHARRRFRRQALGPLLRLRPSRATPRVRRRAGDASRMKRRLHNLVTALSLQLCVAMVALWVRSYFCYDLLAVHPGDAWLSADARLGEVWISFAADRSRVNTPRGLTTSRIT